MKTRIIHTKIWEDEYFASLSLIEKLLFMYYMTNSRINLTGIYEVTDRVVAFETGVSTAGIDNAKSKFNSDGKIIFLDNWVYVKNSSKFGGYKGEKINKALENEVSTIPDAVYEYFKEEKYIDTLSIVDDTVSAKSDTTINHKSEIINHKLGVVKGKILSGFKPNEIVFQEISLNYHVPISFVASKWDDIQNYCASTGKNYKDYEATLRNWVKRDAIKLKERGVQDDKKRGIDASQI